MFDRKIHSALKYKLEKLWNVEKTAGNMGLNRGMLCKLAFGTMWIALNHVNSLKLCESLGFTRTYVNRSKSYELISTFDTISTMYSRVLRFSWALSAFFLQKFDILSRKTSFEKWSIHQQVTSILPSKFPNKYHTLWSIP